MSLISRRYIYTRISVLVLVVSCLLVGTKAAQAACGATVKTWDAGAGNDDWTAANNWDTNTVASGATESAIIVSASFDTQVDTDTTISCVSVLSGQLDDRGNRTLTITGDYFYAPYPNTVAFTQNTAWLEMAGTAEQTLTLADPIRNLRISNNTTVILKGSLRFDRELSLTGTSTTVYIDNDIRLNNTDLTIPSGVTVHLRSGARFLSNVNITVNGSLKLDPGTSLEFNNNRTLDIAAGGYLELNGTSGNPASILAQDIGDKWNFTLAGTLRAKYFRIERTTAAGLNVTGRIQAMDYGEFHYIATNGYAMTLGAAAILPADMDYLSFNDDTGFNNNYNINAASYNVADFNLNNWSGSRAGATYERNDTNNRVDWGSADGITLGITKYTASGQPTDPIAQAATATFGTWAFSLNQAATATNITSITFTQTGTATNADIASVSVYRDNNNNCAWDNPGDSLIDTKSLTGSPGTATFAFSAGQVQTDNSTDRACVHMRVTTAATASNNKTIEFEIYNTADVTNDQNYSFSETSGPSVSGGVATINGDTADEWTGNTSVNFNVNGNWYDNSFPAQTAPHNDCVIGVGARVAQVNIDPVICQNAQLLSNGTLDFNSTTNEFRVMGSLDVASGYNFTNAATGIIGMKGSNNQNLSLGTDFPGRIVVNNSGTSPDNVVSVSASATVTGALTIQEGVLSIANGVTLTVNGAISVESGGVLEILPGGTLALGGGNALTVDSGGVLRMIGTSGLTANMTSASGSKYNVVINGEIQAQYYKFTRMAAAGISIESGATINTTYYLQNGAFEYPVDNSTTMLFLKKKVPGDALTNMSFSANGSSATGVKNIDTTGAAAGTLTVTTYSGDLAGPTFDTDPNYAISWSGATNTITIVQDETSPATVYAGGTYDMGRYRFYQTLASASYSDTNLTSLTLRLLGTASASDVTDVRIYRDSSCDGSSLVLLDNASFTGNPEQAVFSIVSGDFVISKDAASPPQICIAVQFDISPTASNGKTVGVEFAQSTHQVNSQSYLSDSSLSYPITLGTPATISGSNTTTWLGTTDSTWSTATNWTSGVPSSTQNCVINDVTNDPVINGITATCKSLTINNGVLTFTNATGAKLDLYGSLTNTGTITQNDGVIRFYDAGGALDQTISSNSTLTNVQVEKTGGGNVFVASHTTINSLVFNTGNTSTFKVSGGYTLTLPNGVSIPNGTFELTNTSTLEIGNAQTLTVNGGTFKTTGVHDVYPLDLTQKAKITVQTAGTWNFTVSSGTLYLKGFVLDYLGTDGLNISSGVNFSYFGGGRFTNLSTSYASVKVMQINTSILPAAAPSDVEWNWGPNNAPPASTDGFKIATSTGCGSNTITFYAWDGDWYNATTNTPDPSTKISQVTCDIVISQANSPVSLLSFNGTGYDSSALLEWVTGSETGHQGFNIYRSQSIESGYVQLNSDLIRNNYSGYGPNGFYAFVDHGLSNGRVYYYMIEDVGVGGTRTKHGPVSIIPLPGLGTAPDTFGGNTNGEVHDGTGDSGNSPDVNPIQNGNLKDLGQGIHILAQSSNSLKLEIIPPTLSFHPSEWDSLYVSARIPGYGKQLVAGYPEYLEKIVLIEVDENRTTAQLSDHSLILGADRLNTRLQPAPSWNYIDAESGSSTLQPTYQPNGAVYGLDSFTPTTYFVINPILQTIGHRKYLEIKINPFLYNPVQQIVRPLQKLTLEIGLDGQAWILPTTPPELALVPAAVAGALRVQYEKAGMFQVTFDDLEALGLSSYYRNLEVAKLRGYYLGREIPLDVISLDAYFNSGDKIIFWGNADTSSDSNLSETVITPVPAGHSAGAPLRFENLDARPLGAQSTQTITEAKVKFEQDHIFLNDRIMGDLAEHFYWVRLGAWQDGRASYYPSSHQFVLNLPGLVRDPNRRVLINIKVRGRTQFSKDGPYRFNVYVNNSINPTTTAEFDNFYPTTIVLSIPSSQFVNGENKMTIENLASQLPTVDWSLLDINAIEVYYSAVLSAIDDSLTIYKAETNVTHNITGFTTTDLYAYDLSNSNPSKLVDLQVQTPDGGLTQTVSFAIPQLVDEDRGGRVLILGESELLKPKRILMSTGFEQSLKNTTRQADMIVIGSKEMLDATYNLIKHRESQGLVVVPVSTEQIYTEFSHGKVDVLGIRDFLLYAYDHWLRRPKYVLLAGDGTSDPKGILGFLPNENVTPVPFVSGYHRDYGSDSWFVSRSGETLPLMALGRIPASNSLEMEGFVKKLIEYEAGDRAPRGLRAKSFSFFADKDTLFENFDEKSRNLTEDISTKNPKAVTYHKSYADYAGRTEFNAELVQEFTDAPFVLSVVSHGSQDRFGDDILYESEVKGFVNHRLPVVVGLNCSTGYFYDPDVTKKSIGESLVMNPEGGAIAYWGSTTETTTETQVRLTQSFYEEAAAKMVENPQYIRLGDMMLKAKTMMEGQSSAKAEIMSWTLIGDPATTMPNDSFTENRSSSDGGGCGMIHGDSSGSNHMKYIYLLLLLLPTVVYLRLRALRA